MDQISLLLEQTPPFDMLTRDDRRRVLDGMLIESYQAGTRILEQGQEEHRYLYLIVSGHVRLFDTKRQRLIDAYGEGDVFGHYGLLRSGPLPYEATAEEDTVCALIPAPQFHLLYNKDEAFAAFFDRDLKQYARILRTPVDAAGARLLFGTRLADLIRREPVACPPGTSVRDAARLMRDERVGSILITENDRALGILTNTDLRDTIVAGDASPDTPVEKLMSRPVISLGQEATVFDGLLVMMQHGMHHLVVTTGTDPDTPVRGIVSDQDIARAHGYNPASIIKRIEGAPSVSALTGIRLETNGLLLQLYRQGVQPEDLIAINTDINDHLTVRVLRLVEAELTEARPDLPVDVPWVWMALGSEGREEMSLKTDQDNALLYADIEDEHERARAEAWFSAFAERANQALAECGFTLCPGDVMARNPKWRQPLRQWKRIFRTWILDPEPKAVMHASIFFDLRGLYGRLSLINELVQDLHAALDDERGFLAFLMHDAQDARPPLSFFRRFVLERSGEHRHTFDVKLRGLMPVVDMARIMALDARFLDSTNTFDRLRHVRQALPRLSGTAENLYDAYRFLVDLRLDYHLRAIEEGASPGNHIDPSTLSKLQQNMLKQAFAAISDAQETLSHHYGSVMMRR